MPQTTVADLFDLVDGILAEQSAAAKRRIEDRNFSLANAAARMVWQKIVSHSHRNNWFVVPSQAITPLNDDYFAPLVTTAREFVLPPSFHAMRAIEVTTAGKEGVRFIKANITDEEFLQDRRGLGSFTDQVFYDIVASRTLILSQFPLEALTLRLFFVRQPAKIIAKSDSLDDFPAFTFIPMARWAATAFVLGGEPAKFGPFQQEWNAEILSLLAADDRDTTAPKIVRGYLEW